MTRTELDLVLLTGMRLGFADAASAATPGGGYRRRAAADVRAALDAVNDAGFDPLVFEVIMGALAKFEQVGA
jgi:hypothetical protein